MKKKSKRVTLKEIRELHKEGAVRFVDRVLDTKQRQKEMEVVNVTIKVICPNPRDTDIGVTFELETQTTRGRLKDIQDAHANGTLMINWIREM